MARQSRGKSEHCDWFFLDWDFAIRIVSVEMVISCVFFCFQKPTNSKFGAKTSAINYDKLLTNLACSSRTGEYWPPVVFVQNSLSSVRTASPSGQYSPVRPSRSVSKNLLVRPSRSVSKNLLVRPSCSVSKNLLVSPISPLGLNTLTFK